MWIGAVAAMWLLGRRDRQLHALWPSISTLAAIGLAPTGASGLLLSGRVAVTVTALLGTTYGQRIVIKAGLLVVLAILGTVATRRVRARWRPRRLPLELAVAGVAIVIAGCWSSRRPARGEQFLPAPEEQPQVVTSDPARPDRQRLDRAGTTGAEPRAGPVLDTRRPAPGPIENVTLRINGGDGVRGRRATGRACLRSRRMGRRRHTQSGHVPCRGQRRPSGQRPVSPVRCLVGSRSGAGATCRPGVVDAILGAAGRCLPRWVVLVAAGWWGTRRFSPPSRREASPASDGRSFGPIVFAGFSSGRPVAPCSRRGDAPAGPLTVIHTSGRITTGGVTADRR